MHILSVGAKDGEHCALLSRFREEPVHKHGLRGEGERLPGLPFVGTVSAQMQARGCMQLASPGQGLGFRITLTPDGNPGLLGETADSG